MERDLEPTRFQKKIEYVVTNGLGYKHNKISRNRRQSIEIIDKSVYTVLHDLRKTRRMNTENFEEGFIYYPETYDESLERSMKRERLEDELFSF